MCYVGITQSYQNNSQILSSSALNMLCSRQRNIRNTLSLLLKPFLNCTSLKQIFLGQLLFPGETNKMTKPSGTFIQKSSISFDQKIRLTCQSNYMQVSEMTKYSKYPRVKPTELLPQVASESKAVFLASALKTFTNFKKIVHLLLILYIKIF